MATISVFESIDLQKRLVAIPNYNNSTDNGNYMYSGDLENVKLEDFRLAHTQYRRIPMMPLGNLREPQSTQSILEQLCGSLDNVVDVSSLLSSPYVSTRIQDARRVTVDTYLARVASSKSAFGRSASMLCLVDAQLDESLDEDEITELLQKPEISGLDAAFKTLLTQDPGALILQPSGRLDLHGKSLRPPKMRGTIQYKLPQLTLAAKPTYSN